MTEITGIPERNENSPKKDEAIILDNLRLLNLRIIKGLKRDEVDDVTWHRSHAIHMGGTMLENGKALESIKIEYNTASGRIDLADKDFEIGEHSRLHSYIVTSDNEDGVYTILLYQPGNMPTVEQYTSAIAGQGVEIPDDRRILPERVMPEHHDLLGPRNTWGQSEFTDNVHGDMVMLKTLQRFNEQFGPPR